MIDYFLNFEKLGERIYFNYTQDKAKFEQLRNAIESVQYFKKIEPLDKTKQGDISQILNILYRRVLEQPFWYIDAINEFPFENIIDNKAKHLYDKIKFRLDKFDEFNFSIKAQFNDLERTDKEAANRMYNAILQVVEDILLFIYTGYFKELLFDYKKSPLFIQFMEFIDSVKKRAGNPYYEEIDNYLKEIETYKSKFFTTNNISNKIFSTQSEIESPQAQKIYNKESSELYRDMPFRTNKHKANDPNYVPIEFFPGSYYYIGKTVSIDLQIKKLLLLAGSDTVTMKRLFDMWYTLHLEKEWLLKSIRKFIIIQRRPLSQPTDILTLSSSHLDFLSEFVNKHKNLLLQNQTTHNPPNNYPTMSLIPEETTQRYAAIYGKLMSSKNPARMLIELKENGFKYISEDFVQLIDREISENNKLIMDLILANPKSNPENIGIPSIKIEIEKARKIRDLFTEKIDNNFKNPLLNEAIQTWEKSKFLNKYVIFLEIIDTLYIRKEVSDLMIKDFLLGMPLIPKSIVEKNEVLGKELDSLVQPVMDKILVFLKTDFLEYNAQKNIDSGEGLEKVTVDGWEVPITPEKIIRYIKETKSPFLTPKNIRDAKLGFIKQQKLKETQRVNNIQHHSMSNIIQIDYIEIVLGGYSTSNTRAHLPEYFFREFKKAEKEYFGFDEFFEGCLQVIGYLEADIKQRLYERKNELWLMKSAAEKGTLNYPEDNSSKTIEQQHIETIEYCDDELKNITLEWFPANLAGITKNRFYGNLPYSKVLLIKEAIIEAKQKVIFDINSAKEKKTEKKLKTGKITINNIKDIFNDPNHMQPCIGILRDLSPPVIDSVNNYIGKAKGIFPLWIKILQRHIPKPIIKHCTDITYKDILNATFPGLNLSKDASEFRKEYKRLSDNNIELEIKTLLSQLSQDGKLGK